MSNPWRLSEREEQVMTALIAHGSAKMAGRSLGIETVTVQTHITNVMRRMGARTSIQASIWWDRWTTTCLALPPLSMDHRDRVNGELAMRLRQACREAA